MTKQLPTSKNDLVLIEKFISEASGTLTSLYGRWISERAHENIADYGKVLAEMLPNGFKFEKMTARPFAINFSIGDQVGYSVYINKVSMGWSRSYTK